MPPIKQTRGGEEVDRTSPRHQTAEETDRQTDRAPAGGKRTLEETEKIRQFDKRECEMRADRIPPTGERPRELRHRLTTEQRRIKEKAEYQQDLMYHPDAAVKDRADGQHNKTRKTRDTYEKKKNSIKAGTTKGRQRQRR